MWEEFHRTDQSPDASMHRKERRSCGCLIYHSPTNGAVPEKRASRLPRECHQRRVEHDGQQQMTNGHGRQGEDSHEILDLPVVWYEGCCGEHDHAHDAEEGKGEAELELLDDFRDFDKEVGEFGFLGGGAPGHVDFEHVGEESGGDVERKTTQENGEHENPLEVLEDWKWLC